MANRVGHVKRAERGGSPLGDVSLGEFDIIARYFAPLATEAPALALGDDAAVLPVFPGEELVVTCDTLVEGVHFLPDDPPASIGHKVLAVNLSDLAAKGAEPYAYLLALSLREATPEWLEGFARGLGALQRTAGIALIGGDTSGTPGPITLSVTALGRVPQGKAVLRSGARGGDRIYVSGSIGAAHLGLRLRQAPRLAKAWVLAPAEAAALIERYQRPEPRCRLAPLLRRYGHAAIDVSDGLVGDIEKLCTASKVAAVIQADRVPHAAAVDKALAREPQLLHELITAGDDYEIVAVVPEARAVAFEAAALEQEVRVTAIGKIVVGNPEVAVLDGEGRPLKLPHKGYAHFRASP
ncbi:MAG: thiamine-phosphate kinase [Methyloceanibacter sp.]